MSAMLEVKNIHCAYDAVAVIHGISLGERGRTLIAITRSERGRQMHTMRTIAGLMHPTSGTKALWGRTSRGLSASKAIRKGLSYVPDGRRLFAKRTVRENLELGAFTTKDRKEIDERLEEMYDLFPILKDRRDQTAETMSGGEQQMCAIARGLMSRPKLLLLDELSLGLQPSLVEKVFETVVEINKRGVTILLVEQMVQEALEIASRGYVIQTGTIVHSGTARELLCSEEVRKAYMGM